MIQVQVENLKEFQTRLAAFGNDAPKLLDRSLMGAGQLYKKYVIRNFLSGQLLGVRTGDTGRAMRAYKLRGKHIVVIGNKTQTKRFVAGLANIYEHSGGVDIKPKNALVLRFIGKDGQVVFSRHSHLERKPFMSDSSSGFDFNSAFEEKANQQITKAFKKFFEE